MTYQYGDPSVALELQQVSLDVLREKYAKGVEKTLDGPAMIAAIRQRVAKALADNEKTAAAYEGSFVQALRNGFIPGGRINSTAGTAIRHATLINCFVQPVGDSIAGEVDGKVGIYTALLQAAETMRRGGGVGYDFSAIRPSGAKVKGTASNASGPVSYMHVFNQSCATVESAGARRGAQMGVLRVDHPDIIEFVHAKQEAGALSNFNLSVGITDHFMRDLGRNEPFQLVHKAEPSDAQIAEGAVQREDGLWVYHTINPRELWDTIMRNTYNTGEPGVLFLDRINDQNNLYYCEEIQAVNPCGEECLADYSCCCLGSINLTHFVREPFTKKAIFDTAPFGETVRTAIRMLDNVLDVTDWALEEQRREAMNKRRVGLGFTGLGDTLLMLRAKYDSEAARAMAGEIAQVMRDEAYRASIELAKEKGAFPLFDADKYLASQFVQRLPEGIREAIREHGIRNSHLLSIAPTGTISLAFADNCSNGIEPAFSWYYNRKKRQPDGTYADYQVADHGYRLYGALGHDQKTLPAYFVSALEISAKDHMRMQAAVQPYIDAGISKTVNVPADYPFAQFRSLYTDAWNAGLKGITTFRPNAIIGSLSRATGTPFELAMPPDAHRAPVPGNVAAMARLIRYRCDELGLFDRAPEKTPLVDAMFSRKEPKSGTEGTLAWTVDVNNPNTGDDFALFLKECVLPDGTTRPYSVWLAGNYPRDFDGLAKSLSLDMRVLDPAWIGKKLRGLMNMPEPQGDFFAKVPGQDRQALQPSTVGYIARLLIHRYHRLGILDETGYPLKPLGMMQSVGEQAGEATPANAILVGKPCPECGSSAMIRRDGCDFCTACGYTESCG